MAYSFIAYEGNGTTDTFAINFEYATEDTLLVTVDNVIKVLNTDFTINENQIVFTTAPEAGSVVLFERQTDIEDPSVVWNSGSIFTEDNLNTAFSQLFFSIQELTDGLGRVPKQSKSDSLLYDITIPPPQDGFILKWDGDSGALVNSDYALDDITTLTLGYKEDAEDAATAANASAVSASASEAHVSIMEDNVENLVDTVTAFQTEIVTVSNNIADVVTVADNVEEVVIVGDNISAVVTVANDLNESVSEIETVAGSITNVNTVGTNISSVNTVSGISTKVSTVADISTNVTTVANISSNVTTVAGNATNINTVAGINTAVSAVAADTTNINAVAADLTNIDAVAAELPQILTKVSKTSNTGSAVLPTGTTGERDGSPSAGYFRYNTTNAAFEGYNGSAWAGVGGASGGGGNPFVYENDQTVSVDYTITSGKNGMTAGPISINSGVTVNVPSGSTWVII